MKILYQDFFFLFFTVGFFAFSCSENPSSPSPKVEPDPNQDPNPEVTTGKIEISIVTTGLDPNPRGYTINIENEDAVEAGPNETITSEDIEEGSYSVELTDVEDHCTLQSENPVAVEVIAEETASVEFEVTCKGIFREKIVFFRAQSQNKKSGNSKLSESYFTMNYDGSDLEKVADLTQNGRVYFSSDISPDGTKMVIAYSENINGSYTNYRIAIIEAYDNELKYLIDESEDIQYFQPVFSPDGTKIAFTGRGFGGVFGDIFIMNTDGSGLVNVTNSEELEESPSWSPDGTQIIFRQESTSYKDLGIFVINTDGSGLKLIKNSEMELTSPQWSPDGDKIAVVGSQFEPYYYQEIYVMNIDGSSITKVAGKQGESIYYSNLTWSPDGSRLLFASNRDGNPDDEFGYAYVPMDIFTINADGSNLMNFTNTPNIDESNLMWSP